VRSYKRSCTSILEILLTNFRCTFHRLGKKLHRRQFSLLHFVDKIWKNSSLFPILRIFILQIASDLTVFTKDVFDISFVNGLHVTLHKCLIFFLYLLLYFSVFYSVLNFFLKRTCVLCGFVENKSLHMYVLERS
jgi:hypothetical protein